MKHQIHTATLGNWGLGALFQLPGCSLHALKRRKAQGGRVERDHRDYSCPATSLVSWWPEGYSSSQMALSLHGQVERPAFPSPGPRSFQHTNLLVIIPVIRILSVEISEEC